MNTESQAIAAVKDGLACHEIGQLDTARALFVEALALFDSVPVSGQAAHLQSAFDSYELTNKTAHIGEFSE